MQALRHAQIKAYFFGHTVEYALAPHSQSADYSDLNIFRVVECKSSRPIASGSNLVRDDHDMHRSEGNICAYKSTPASSNPNDPDSDAYEVFGSTPSIYEKVVPSPDMVGKLLAITTAVATDRHEMIRDSSVRGYMWVADVDEGKKRVKVLCPQPGMVVSNALVLGRWPDDVAGLVS